MGDHMEIKMQIEKLYKALNDSELPDKAELKREIGCCINSLIDYYHTIVNEQLYYSSTVADERNSFIMKQKDEQRSEKHDDCIRSCARLNEICQAAGVEPLCDFDITDRRRVAEFCGFVVSELFYSNINCKDPMASWISFENPDVSDSDVFAKVYADFVTNKFNRRFSEIKISCEDARIECDEIFFVYKDSKGEGNTLVGDIDMLRLNEYGYISKRINETYLFLVSVYEQKGFK